VKSFKKCGISNALVATEGAVLSEGSESSELTTVMMIVMKTSSGGMTSMKFILHHHFAKCVEFELCVFTLFFPETCHLNSLSVLWPGKSIVSASQENKIGIVCTMKHSGMLRNHHCIGNTTVPQRTYVFM
jgi:hypothetical protein